MKSSFLHKTLTGTKKYIAFTLILSAIYSRLVVYIPKFIQYALDGVISGNENVIPNWIKNLYINNEKIGKIITLSIILIIINILIFIVNYIKSKTNTKFNLKINKNVKELILEHIPKIEYLEFSNIDKANVIQRINKDATIYAEFFNSQINLFFDTVFIVVFAIAQTFSLNLVVGIFIAIVCVIIAILSIWEYKVTKPLIENTVEKNKEIINKTTVSIEESKMLKIFNRKDIELKDFRKINKEYKEKEIKFQKYRTIYTILVHSIRNFKEPFILLYGGILVVNGQLTLAEIAILLSFATKTTTYIYNSSEKISFINEFIVAYKKLSELMKHKEDIETNPDIELSGDIIFNKVTIKIQENTILKNLSFTIKQGENFAIVGDNGTGKTIIAKTLIGFYEYDGEIFIGNNNLKKVSKKSIRDYIGVVLQDTYLFTDTIKNNINIKNKIVSNEEIIKVCKLADIYEDLKGFEGNIDYMIGKGGNNISGGQKQRIAIARTLLLDNQFIIFDDSLSKLDTKTKITILNNLISLKKGTIIISHDTEIMKKCDKVLFIDENTIKVGTHKELMDQSKNYKNIIENSQNKILEEEEI